MFCAKNIKESALPEVNLSTSAQNTAVILRAGFLQHVVADAMKGSNHAESSLHYTPLSTTPRCGIYTLLISDKALRDFSLVSKIGWS